MDQFLKKKKKIIDDHFQHVYLAIVKKLALVWGMKGTFYECNNQQTSELRLPSLCKACSHR